MCNADGRQTLISAQMRQLDRDGTTLVQKMNVNDSVRAFVFR